MKFKIIFAGCGDIAFRWLDHIMKRDDCEIIAIVEKNPQRAVNYQQRYNFSCKIYDSLEEAIAGYTTEAAPGSFEEDRKGRIAPGFLADFIILSADPFQTDPKDLHKIRVLETWVNGKRTHCESSN